MADPTDVGLTELAKLVFGKDVLEKYQSLNTEKRLAKGKTPKKRAARGIWELTAAREQCKNVLEPLVIGKSLCWICGFLILQLSGLTYECEHVLPVAQAVFFLNLYSPNLQQRMIGHEKEFFHINNDTNIQKQWAEWNKQALHLEYDFAHEYCNQIKKDASFIRFDSLGNIIPNEQNISDYLDFLFTSTREGSEEIHRFINDIGINNWKRARQEIVVKRYRDIANLISKGQPGISNMIVLSGLINVLDKNNIQDQFVEILNDSPAVNSFVNNICLTEFALRNNWKALVTVITNSIFRNIRKSIEKEPAYWIQIENRIAIDFQNYESDTNSYESNSNNSKSMNINMNKNENFGASLLVALPARVRQELQVPPEEIFAENVDIDYGFNNTNNTNIIEQPLNDTEKHFINTLQKVVDNFAFRFYEKIYKAEFQGHTRVGIPTNAEAIAIEVVQLYVFAYLLNIVLHLDKERIRPRTRVQNKKGSSIIDYLRKNVDVLYETLMSEGRIINPDTKRAILGELNTFPSLLEDYKRRYKNGGGRKTKRSRSSKYRNTQKISRRS